MTSSSKIERAVKGGRTAITAAGLVLGLVLTAGVVVWGRSDTGQIDVSATIQNSQNSGVRDENAPAPAPAISNELAEMKNGGLVPVGTNDAPAPEPTPITESVTADATTTAEEGDATNVQTEAPATDTPPVQ